MLSFSSVPMSVCVFVTPRDILCTTTTRTDCISFVIVKAFYPLLLTVASKFGVHFQPIKKTTVIGCRTLLPVLYLFNWYALQYLIAFRNLLSYLGVIFSGIVFVLKVSQQRNLYHHEQFLRILY